MDDGPSGQFCGQCGQPLTQAARFCGFCGRAVPGGDGPGWNEAGTPTPAAAPPAGHPGLGPAAGTDAGMSGAPYQGPPTGYPPQDPPADYPVQDPATGYPPQDPAVGYPVQDPATGYPPQDPATGYPPQDPATGYPPQDPAVGYPVQDPATGYPPQGPPAGYPVQGPPAGYAGPAPAPDPGLSNPTLILPLPGADHLPDFGPVPPGRGTAVPAAGRGGHRFRWSRTLTIAVLAVVAGSAAVALIASASTSAPGRTGASAGTSPPAAAASLSSPSAQRRAAQRQAARRLSVLLARSVADRASVDAAAADLARCGPHIARDAAVFRADAASRRTLISRLAALPGAAALPKRMIRALTEAWRASAQADRDFAAWANDETSRRCRKNPARDPHYRAAAGPDSRATLSKEEFVSRWNPLATRYGLATYQSSQL